MSESDPRPPGPAQLPLELPAEPRYSDDEFLVSPSNRAAFEMIRRWPDWPDPTLLLVGPAGAGKSHLGAIWSRRSSAALVDPARLPAPHELEATPARAFLLDGLESACDDKSLFHFLNFVRETGAALLMSARRPPSAAEIALPDLLSRLRRAPVVEIGSPDDALIRAVLEKLFRDRQLLVEASLIEFIALRLERSLEAARVFVRLLDRESLARGRRVTRALASDLLHTSQSS